MDEEKKKGGILPKVVGAIAFIIFFYWGYNNFSLDFLKSNETLVQEAVTEIKQTTKLPQTIDEYTTWTNITANNDAIRYDYTISGLDTTTIDNSSLKATLLPNICNNSELKDLLNNGINLEYAYTDNATSKTFLAVFTISDCL